MNYENLFRPGYIGGLRIKNRVVMTAMGNGLAAENGEASDEIIACYKARAAGGCGLLITEFCAVDGKTASPRPISCRFTRRGSSSASHC